MEAAEQLEGGGVWVCDISTQHTALSTTGGRVWAAAHRLAEFLEVSVPQLGLNRHGLRLLELGAGCGWLGMVVARNLPNAGMVCMTEQAEGLPWLQHNISLNKHLPGMASVTATVCDWMDYGAEAAADAHATAASSSTRRQSQGPACAWHAPQPPPQGAGAAPPSVSNFVALDPSAAASSHAPNETVVSAAPEQQQQPWQEQQQQPPTPSAPSPSPLELSSQPWDLIIGSDLVYNEIGAVYLPRVICSLASERTVVLYCHTKHRFDVFDMRFFDELAACGLACREVREQGRPSPPPSPPPLTELFPEMRIAIFRIEHTAGPAGPRLLGPGAGAGGGGDTAAGENGSGEGPPEPADKTPCGDAGACGGL